MCTITATELKKNLGKYMILGQTEEIEVTNRGKVVFYITPERIKLINKVEKMFLIQQPMVNIIPTVKTKKNCH